MPSADDYLDAEVVELDDHGRPLDGSDVRPPVPRRPGVHRAQSDTPYEGNMIAVREDVVNLPDGSQVVREVVEHLGAVAVAAIDAQHQIALIQQYRHPLGRRLFELPAGLLDVPGEHPVSAAARELLEEAGVAATTWRVLVDAAVSPGFTDEVVRIFFATGLSFPGRSTAGVAEEADLTLHWVPVPEAVDMVMRGQIVNAVAAAGIFAAQMALTGHQTRPADAHWQDMPTAFERRKARSANAT